MAKSRDPEDDRRPRRHARHRRREAAAAGRDPPAERLRSPGAPHHGRHGARAASATASPSSGPTSSTRSTSTTPPSGRWPSWPQVAQLLWAVPLALWADRGSRKVVAAVALLVFSVFAPLMALAPNVWAFTFPYLIASVGFGVNNTVHNSYLSDAYPTEGRGRVFSWHNLSDPLSQTVGHPHLRSASSPWATTGARACSSPWPASPSGCPCSPCASRTRAPTSRATSCKASGMDLHTQQGEAPRVLLGSAVTRLLRIRSIYFELVAVAILGLRRNRPPRCSATCTSSGAGAWTPPSAARSTRSSGWPPSSGCRWPTCWGTGSSGGPPSVLWSSPASASPPTGVCTSPPSTCPSCGWWCCSSSWPTLRSSPLAICIFLTLAATAPPEMRTICFAMFGVYSLVFGGFTGGVLLGAISDAVGYLHGPTVALTLIGPVCAIGGILLFIGSRYVKRDITLVIEDVLERYAEGQRRQAGGAVPALQVHNLDFYYGTNQVLFDINLEIAPGRDRRPAGHQRRRQVHPAAGGVRSGPSPPRGHPHLRGQLHLPRTRADHRPGRGAAGRRQDDLPRAHRAGQPADRRAHSLRGQGPRPARLMGEAVDRFPELAERLDQPAGTLSGRRAADAGAGPGDDDPAEASADRRAGARARPHGRRPADGHRARGERAGDHGRYWWNRA